jgi:hypothetical protein
MQHTALWSCTHIPNKYYLKNNYLTLRSKVKVPRRSLWYATHLLMVMHLHTKYHWPISKDKNVMAWTRKYLEVKGQGPTKVITERDTPPYSHAPTYQISLTYLERQKSYGPDKLHWEEAEEVEAEEKIRLKQYVFLRSKGRHNKVSEWLLFNTKWPIFQLNHDENKLL